MNIVEYPMELKGQFQDIKSEEWNGKEISRMWNYWMDQEFQWFLDSKTHRKYKWQPDFQGPLSVMGLQRTDQAKLSSSYSHPGLFQKEDHFYSGNGRITTVSSKPREGKKTQGAPVALHPSLWPKHIMPREDAVAKPCACPGLFLPEVFFFPVIDEWD